MKVLPAKIQEKPIAHKDIHYQVLIYLLVQKEDVVEFATTNRDYVREKKMTVNDIPPMFDRRPLIGSYTMLDTYKKCQHQMYRRYIAKDQPFVESPEMKWGSEVHAAFEYRVGGGKALPANMQQWEEFAAPFDGKGAITEQKLGMTIEGRPTGFFDKDVWFRGKLDVTIISGTTAYIPDWKTGNSKYEDPFELETNAVLLHAKHPALTKIMGCYVWLKDNRISQTYDLSHTLQTWTTMQRMMAEIIEKRATPATYQKNQTPLCSYCSVGDCEHWKPRPVR